ncbi:MAG: tetratricopeptide repeat protein [Desulfuromonadales bacterium]|nr:tetratricopeptide repeat protein [Desulfuromonadales bacterium]
MKKYIKVKPKTCFLREVVFIILLMATSSGSLHAAEWQKLTQTAHHKVSIEMESMQQNASGYMMALLQFTPRGELQRRTAASKYGYKEYLLHQEKYEIDCVEKSARLEFLDILGWEGKRLVRMPGSNRKEAIIPGSVLDRVATLVCPEEEKNTDEDETSDLPEDTKSDESGSDVLLSLELRQRIDDAQVRTVTEPGNFNAWVELGNAWYDADMPKQAIEAYNRALEFNPNDSDVLNDQGAMYRQSGDTRRALANFEKALAIDPGNLESLYNMGYIYAFDLKRTDRALEIWQRYLTLDKSSETAEQVRSFIKQHGKTAEKR